MGVCFQGDFQEVPHYSLYFIVQSFVICTYLSEREAKKLSFDTFSLLPVTLIRLLYIHTMK